jgi:tRNA uridine 5-carboxymethylaminomethyl modification enzyme
MNRYDVIVVGAGHAGLEASYVCGRLGLKTLLITLHKETIGLMSCNPAIGGVGKGQLVREIDALGGQMAVAADSCAIQFHLLNASKGPAVQSSRAQIDREKYKQYHQDLLGTFPNVSICEDEVIEILAEAGVVQGLKTRKNGLFSACAVVIAPGTFLNGLIHIGLKNFPGGRINEEAAVGLTNSLRNLGFKTLRFKTGTCARLDGRSINFKKLKIQPPDKKPYPFSLRTKRLKLRQVPCYITYTNSLTHKIIRDNLKSSPLYGGIIKATGVRYCPSIEDKVVKFPQRQRHQIFLEPEGIDTYEFYPNGVSTSLPEEVQIKMLRSIAGLQEVKLLRFGYGIEHDVVCPTQLKPSLETKCINNLFLAGQINGTTGYEEAAAQGLIAGINAALRIKKRPPFVLERSSSYIGVMIDDLIAKGTDEPYRMFTSRVEYRLILREDNAHFRLAKFGYNIGLRDKKDYVSLLRKERAIIQGIDFLQRNKIGPSDKIKKRLPELKTHPLKKTMSLSELVKRPEMDLGKIKKIYRLPSYIRRDILKQIQIRIKYAHFIRRQKQEVEKFKNLEKIKIPSGIDYNEISGLSREIKEKLNNFKPFNLGQASRIPGVTPASISLLMVWIRKYG